MNRRDQWVAAILRHGAAGMTGEVRALLLYVAFHPRTKATAVWSIPRSELAATFDVHPRRITERIQRAHHLGLLDTVVKGRPGTTAVYQGTIPAPNMVRSTAPRDGALNCTIDTAEHGALQQPPTVEANEVSRGRKQVVVTPTPWEGSRTYVTGGFGEPPF